MNLKIEKSELIDHRLTSNERRQKTPRNERNTYRVEDSHSLPSTQYFSIVVDIKIAHTYLLPVRHFVV
jgi:hypothetical protein